MKSSTLTQQAFDRYYEHLNEMQRQAVFSVHGPLLILAGAGSGKTTVLINRIDYMIRFGNAYFGNPSKTFTKEETSYLNHYIDTGEGSDEKLQELLAYYPIEPWKVLAITFTNKAADELKERLETQLGDIALSIQASTFHSLCVRILRREIPLMGYDTSFTIYDTDDSLRIVRDGIKANQLSEQILPARSVLTAISRAKDDLTTPEELYEKAAGDYRAECIAEVYKYYQTTLKNANALDFDDLIVLTVRLFQQYPERLDYYQNRYQYIMVDEYQDTNQAQYLLVSLLAQKRQNLCVVGDDDQSIYKFRGATIENILSFENQFADTKVIRLEQNYRSTQNILSAANAVIENNTERKGKNLWTDAGNGELILYLRAENELEEAQAVAEVIMQEVEQSGSWSNHAVLYRMNAQSNAVERIFTQRAIPYRIIGGLRFYERKEIKDIVAYLSVINNPSDNLRFLRIVNEPRRGIGAVTLASLQEISDSIGESLYETARQADQFAAISARSGALMNFIAMMDDLSEKAEELPLPNFLDTLLEETGYMASLEAQGEEGVTRIENIMELKGNMILFEEEQENATLSTFLEEIALYTDLDTYDQETDVVTLMTVHSAKGLEFPSVYLIGMDEGVFPGRNAQNFPEEIEEERRLAYVAITRAKENLTITSAQRRMLFGKSMWGNTSRFVKEIPEEFLESKDLTQKGAPLATGSTAAAAPECSSRTIGVGAQKARIDLQTYHTGETVKHRIFGEGTIIDATPMGNDTLLEVDFSKVGKKRIMANFAKLEKL